MKFFEYDENSLLDIDFVRYLNYLVLILLVVISFSADIKSEVPLYFSSIRPFIVLILSVYSIKKTLNKIEFFEWDYTERQKRNRYIYHYAILCIFFSGLMVENLSFVLASVKEEWFKIEGLLVYLLPFWVFLINWLNIPTLHYWIFEKDIHQNTILQKKPKWWDSGYEITEEMEDGFYYDKFTKGEL